MKHSFFIPATILFSLFFGFCVQAQVVGDESFAPLGAKWYYKTYSYDEDEISFVTLEANRDTIVENRYCRILELYKEGRGPVMLEFIIHSNDEKVYFFEEGEFKLMYDFSLNEGDTLHFYSPGNRGELDLEHDPVDTFEHHPLHSPALGTIQDVVLETVDGVELKRQEIHSLEGPPCAFYDYAYELLGSTNGFFARTCLSFSSGSKGFLRCYEDANVSINLRGEPCDFATDVSEIENVELKMFPNPAQSGMTLTIELEDHDRSYLRFVHADGRPVSEWKKASPQIAAPNSPGLYFLQIKNGTQLKSAKLLVLE